MDARKGVLNIKPMENEPIPVESSVVLVKDNPTHLMRQATDVAGVCKEIVLKTACNIQGKKYVKCEGWMAIATAHGCIASSRGVQKVEGGFVAIGEIRRIHDGVVLSTAEGFVGRDEKRWSSADEYACRAMAQTRAISRACRAAFAHVVVMMDAGLSTTPFEEVPDDGFNASAPRQQSGGSQSSAPTPAARPTPASAPRPAATTADVSPKPAITAEADKDQRFRFLASLSSNRNAFTPYFVKKGWIKEGQQLEDIPNQHVPTTKKVYDSLMAELQAFVDGDGVTDDEWWKQVVVPFGAQKDIPIGELDKKKLFGWCKNYTVEESYNGVQKTEEQLAPLRRFREALDEAEKKYFSENRD
jgi:hypothetical protein